MLAYFCLSVCEEGIHFIPRTDLAVWCNSSAPECTGDDQATSHVTYSPAVVSDDSFLSNFLNILKNRTKPGNILQLKILYTNLVAMNLVAQFEN